MWNWTDDMTDNVLNAANMDEEYQKRLTKQKYLRVVQKLMERERLRQKITFRLAKRWITGFRKWYIMWGNAAGIFPDSKG